MNIARWALVLGIVLGWAVLAPAEGAVAGCKKGEKGCASSGANFYEAAANDDHGGSSSTDQTATSGDGKDWQHETVCQEGGMCAEYFACGDEQELTEYWWVEEAGHVTDDFYLCPTESEAGPPQVTNAMVARAFRRIPLPESVLVVQPPGGETLVNFATNFYTVAEPFERSVTLVGQRVDLRIRPSGFGWSFGDGAGLSTTGPGAAYPDLQVTHEYVAAGRVGPSVDTTYSAEFRVNGGAWAPVVGTVTMAGAPVGLRVRTATPTLVGYH